MGQVIDFQEARAIKTARDALQKALPEPPVGMFAHPDIIRDALSGAPNIVPPYPGGIDDMEF